MVGNYGKSSTLWLRCNTCSSIVSRKDSLFHATTCPSPMDNWNHSFILDYVLYSTIETIKPQELPKELSITECNNLVFISESAMRLCNFALGDPVVVTTKDTIMVKKVWITNHRSLTSVSLTNHTKELNNLIGLVKIYSMKFNIFMADEIVIKQVGKQSVQDITVELKTLLKYLNNNKIFTIGNKISVPYNAKKLTYKIIQIKTDKNTEKENYLPEAFNNIDLAASPFSDPTKVSFYKAHCKTRWKISNATNKDEQKNKVILTDIGGYDALISNIKDTVQKSINKFKSSEFVNRGILLYGPCGIGKSMIANAIISECNVNSFTVHSVTICHKTNDEIRNNLHKIFKDAILHVPSILLLEDVHIICSKSNNSQHTDSSQLKTFLNIVWDINKDVFVIATTSDLDVVDISLRRIDRFGEEFEIYTPNACMRTEILIKMLSKVPNTLSREDIEKISSVTHGFVAADLNSLCNQAKSSAMIRQWEDESKTVTMVDFRHALKIVVLLTMKEIIVDIPDTRWSDIGGQHDIKLRLKQAVEWPLKYPEAFARMNIVPSKGILLCGPPGCSKTMIAKALATESKLNFINVQPPDLFSMWVGESEKAVRKIFQKARQVAPSIIFIDEIDALGGERCSSSNSDGVKVQERILTELLTELCGVTTSQNSTSLRNVILIATTNRPDKIDSALLRPGRIDHIIYVGLPDNETRQEIFKVKFKNMRIAEDIDVAELAGMTEGYTGAEIQAVCNEAAVEALKQDVTTISKDHFKAALTIVTPKTTSLDLYKNYMNNNIRK